MASNIDHVVILGSTLTALAVARHCRSLGLSCDLVDTTAGPATTSAIPTVTVLAEKTDQEMVAAVMALGRNRRAAVIADSDSWLRWLMRHRSQLDSSFEVILHSQNDALSLCLDKSRFLDWCLQSNLPAPRA